MEDLWKISDMGYRLSEWAERAEYARLLRRFHADEQRAHDRHLMYDGAKLEGVKED